MKNQLFLTGLVIISLLLVNPLVAQQSKPSKDGDPKTFIATLPPVQVRTMAEWEEVEALVIAWKGHDDILYDIVRAAIQECKVFILTDNPEGIRGSFPAHQIYTPASDNVEFINYNPNSIWVRDYGPWSVYHNDVGTLAFTDFLYNRFHRFQDDLAPHELASYLDIPLYNADENPFHWVHTGGNLLRDGMGTAYSSDLLLRENSGKTGLEIESFASRFFGINDYRFLHRLPYDTIHHLDMHIRTLDEETLAVGWYPDGIADGPQIEANLDYLRNQFRTPFGNPYHIIRQQMPPSFGAYPPIGNYRTYTNGIFINKTFLVPIFEEQYDSTALDIYREYLPGYNVVGIDCNEIINLMGALHCITKLVGVKKPLRITHPRLRDTYETGEDYEVEAWVQHTSGIDSVFLHYRLSGETVYDSISMGQDMSDQERWYSNIPAQDIGTEIQYYISAYATNGKRQVRPLPAPEAYYPFRVKAFEQAPDTKWLQTRRTATPEMLIRFTDNSSFGTTEVEWSFPGGVPETATESDVFVSYAEPGVYTAQLITKNPLGEDTLRLEDAVNIKTTYSPFTENFETGISEQWEIQGTQAWELWQGEECHQNSLRVSHQLSNNDLNRTYLRTALNLKAIAYSGLTFDVAYALRDSLLFDELRVNLTDEYGETHNIYNKGGHILTTTNTLIPNFNPNNCDQWRNETIDLREWEGQEVLLEFETIGDQGNNIYLDNITLRANALPYVSITEPIDGTLYIGDGQAISDTIMVEAMDPDGDVEKVSFYANNQFIGDDFEAPYEFIYTIPSYGHYCYQAKAKDNDNLQVWTQQTCVEYDQDTANENIWNIPFSCRINPNPAEDFIYLHIDSPFFSDAIISIRDVQGRTLKQKEISLFEGQFQYPLSVRDFPVGNYYLQIDVREFSKTLAFIKQ